MYESELLTTVAGKVVARKAPAVEAVPAAVEGDLKNQASELSNKIAGTENIATTTVTTLGAATGDQIVIKSESVSDGAQSI
jgi:hypothetical protein